MHQRVYFLLDLTSLSIYEYNVQRPGIIGHEQQSLTGKELLKITFLLRRPTYSPEAC